MAKASKKCTPQKTIKEEMERETNWSTSTRRGASLRNFDAPVPRNQYERVRVLADSSDDGRTEQHHAKACDINTIMMKYQKTGVIDHIKNYEPQYGDVPELDYHAAQSIVAKVKSEFHDLPAYVRDHYDQDEGLYLQAMQTDEGIQELRDIPHPAQNYDKEGAPEAKPAPEKREPEAAPETSDSS